MGQAAEKSVDKFSLEKFADNLLRIFNMVIKEKKAKNRMVE